MVMATPDLVIGTQPYPGASTVRGNPAPPRAAQPAGAGTRAASGPDWICGTPHVVQALAEMAGIRAEIENGE
jgi:iron complex transport system substrate-binding protein